MHCAQFLLRRGEHSGNGWYNTVVLADAVALSMQDVRRAVLPVLATLLSEDSVREHVPHMLAELLNDNKELQATAADADAVTKLALLLQEEHCSLRLKVHSTNATLPNSVTSVIVRFPCKGQACLTWHHVSIVAGFACMLAVLCSSGAQDSEAYILWQP